MTLPVVQCNMAMNLYLFLYYTCAKQYMMLTKTEFPFEMNHFPFVDFVM